jgi:hypothetical protein
MEMLVFLGALSLWLLIPLGIIGIGILGAILEEDGFVASILAGVFTVISLIFMPGLFTWVVENPATILGHLLWYIIIGAVWAGFRWFRYVRNNSWSELPQASHHKNKLGFWGTYWPVDTVFYLFGNFFRDVLKGLWNMLGNVYQKIGEWAYQGDK